MNRKALSSLLAVCMTLLQAEALFAQQEPNANKAVPPGPESCSIDGAAAVLMAIKKGYGFYALEEKKKGGATCKVGKSGEILIASAAASEDGECGFAIFVPPANTPQRILRLALKAAADGSVVYLQRGDKPASGFSTSIVILKGTTTQYRVMHIEVAPVDGACDVAKVGAQL